MYFAKSMEVHNNNNNEREIIFDSKNMCSYSAQDHHIMLIVPDQAKMLLTQHLP